MSLLDLFKPDYVQPIIKSKTDDIEYLWHSDIDYSRGPYQVEVHVDKLNAIDRKLLLDTLIKLYDQGRWKRVGTSLSAVVKNGIGHSGYEKQLLVRWKSSYTLIYKMDDSGCKEMTKLMRKYGSVSYT